MTEEVFPFAIGTRAGLNLIADIRNGTVEHRDVIELGITSLDVITNGGLRSGELSIIGASSGHGKSALAEQLALNISRDHRVTFFALEMGRRRTETRMLAKIMKQDLASVLNLLRQNPNHPRLAAALNDLCYARNLIIEEREYTETFTIDHLLTMVNANAPKVVVIDHPRHLDDWNGSTGLRTDLAAAAIVRRLVAAAQMLDMHIIVVAQTKAQHLGKRPSMRDLADTYALGQSADLCIMVHRPYRGQGFEDVFAELIVDKSRNGREGIVHVRWHGPTMRYSDLTPDEERNLECCKAKSKHDVPAREQY